MGDSMGDGEQLGDRPAPMGPSALMRVLAVPRQDSSDRAHDRDPDPFRSRRAAFLTAAFHSSAVHSSAVHSAAEPLTWIWRRAARGGPIELLTSDPGLAPPGSTVFAPDLPGPEGDFAVRQELGARHWTMLLARHDGLLPEEDRGRRQGDRASRPSIETCLLAVWNDPFVLVVTAEPVRDAEDVIERVADEARYAKQRAEASPDRAVEYDRARAWHRELRAAQTTGLWRIRVAVGADDPMESKALAGLALASYDVESTGYVFSVRQNDGFLASSSLLAVLTVPPNVEVPGVRLMLPSDFDVTPESATGPVELGMVLDRNRREAGPMRLSLESLNRHTFVCGATGSGKSQTIRHLLEEATKQGIPWLVVEPAKSEYAAMATRLSARGLSRSPGDGASDGEEFSGDRAGGAHTGEVVVIRLGDPSGIACGIDPLRPARGFPLQTHLDLTKALFLAAFEAQEPFPQVLAAALTMAYQKQGWDIALSEPSDRARAPRYPTLADLQDCAQRVVDDVGYGQEVQNNIRGFVKVRLGSLRLGTTGRFLEGGHPLDIGRLLQNNVVLEIEDVGDDQSKAFLMGAVLIALTEHYRVAERDGDAALGRLRHITVIEEAHRLLRRTENSSTGPAAQAVEMFAALLAEVRAYGEGLIIAEQIPSKLIPDVVKNTSVKIVHRLPAKDDRDAVGATMNLSESQSRYLVTLPPGTAGVFADGMDNPILTRMPDGSALENTNTGRPGSRQRKCLTASHGIVQTTIGRCGTQLGMPLSTVADLALGRSLLERNPLARWWIELGVLAHLTGFEPPAPNPSLYEELAKAEPRVLSSAIAIGVDEAVATRSPFIVDRMNPADLVRHVFEVLSSVVEGQLWCEYAEPEWLLSPYLWEYVYDELNAHIVAERDAGCGKPHPDTKVWELTYGRRVPGNCRQQRAAVHEWRRSLQSVRLTEDLAFGTAQPSVLESSLDIERVDPQWPYRVEEIAAELHAGWAKGLLRVQLTDGSSTGY